MFKKISAKLVKNAVDKGIISPEAAEENVFGLNTFLTVCLNIATAFVAGLIFHRVLDMAIFIVTYKALRKYVGGKHEDTPLKCYISSCVSYVVVLLIIKYCNVPSLAANILMLCSCAVLIIIAPVEAEKKPLDEIEKRVFGIIGRILTAVSLCVYFALYLYGSDSSKHCSVTVAISVAAVALFALDGKMAALKRDCNEEGIYKNK